MAMRIKELTGMSVEGNRIVIGADDIRHIIKRHGKYGNADHSMEDINDIARLSYVLANYDSIEWDGGVSNLYKTKDGKKAPQISINKRVDGTYYVIQIVSDAKKARSVVSTIYLKKACDWFSIINKVTTFRTFAGGRNTSVSFNRLILIT